MRFWDRKKEKEWLKHYLQTEPNAILFAYGPKSSGKTTFLMKVAKELSNDSFIYYWADLRGKLISSYKDVLEERNAFEVMEKELTHNVESERKPVIDSIR